MPCEATGPELRIIASRGEIGGRRPVGISHDEYRPLLAGSYKARIDFQRHVNLVTSNLCGSFVFFSPSPVLGPPLPGISWSSYPENFLTSLDIVRCHGSGRLIDRTGFSSV